MKYRIQYFDADPNMIAIHLDVSLARFIESAKVEKWSAEYDDFEEKYTIPFFLRRLMAIHGIVDAYFDSYSITVKKGDLFPWRELLKHIVFQLEVNLNLGRPGQRKAKRRTSQFKREWKKRVT